MSVFPFIWNHAPSIGISDRLGWELAKFGVGARKYTSYYASPFGDGPLVEAEAIHKTYTINHSLLAKMN